MSARSRSTRSVFKDLRVKPQKDFIPVSILADMPGLLVANPKFPPNSVKELVDYAKANPGKVNFASPGSGSMNRLEMELFRKQRRHRHDHVPYKGGAGPAATDIIGGHVETMFVTIASTMPHVKGGRLKALAVPPRSACRGLPDVPTMLEQGFPQPSQLLAGHPGAGRHAAGRSSTSCMRRIVETMADPAIVKRYDEIGATATSSKSPQAFLDYIREDAKRWEVIIKEVNATPD